MSKALKPHHSCAAHSNVIVDWNINQETIHFEFEITNYRPHTNDSFSEDYKENWGHWDYDVVEVFIKRNDSDSYLEIQCSPLGTPFALIIEKPRVDFYPPEHLDYKLTSEVLGDVWRSSISIGIDSLPGNGTRLIGNCFACLGTKEEREYYALNINMDSNPDFHRPELFLEFGEMK